MGPLDVNGFSLLQRCVHGHRRAAHYIGEGPGVNQVFCRFLLFLKGRIVDLLPVLGPNQRITAVCVAPAAAESRRTSRLSPVNETPDQRRFGPDFAEIVRWNEQAMARIRGPHPQIEPSFVGSSSLGPPATSLSCEFLILLVAKIQSLTVEGRHMSLRGIESGARDRT